MCQGFQLLRFPDVLFWDRRCRFWHFKYELRDQFCEFRFRCGFRCRPYYICHQCNSIRERPLDSQGGGAWGFFEKNILALVLAKKNILALTICEKNILAPSIEKKMSALYPWKENVCPLSMKRKCLPSIYMKIKCWPSINDIIMDRGQI